MARLLVLSKGKKEKEESMDKLKEKRMLKDLSKLRQSIENRKIILIGKISHLLSRIMERYPNVAKYYEIDLIPDVTGKEASGITWSKKALRDLKEQEDTRKWSTIKKVLSTHNRSTVVLQGEGGQVHYIRISGQPEAEHRDIYKKLGVKDPMKARKVTLNQRK